MDQIQRLPSSVTGGLWQWRVNGTGKPMVFVDEAGFRFWQYPGDRITFNHRRRAVGDSTEVRDYIRHHLARDSICIDIGACIGSISVPLWAAVGPRGKVISIEADPDNIDRLAANLQLNGASDERLLNAAITDKQGWVLLRRFVGHNGWQTIGNPTFAENIPACLIEVPALTIPAVMARYHLKHVDFVKMDVEGAEPLVLEGMREILAQRKVAQVLFEVNHLMLQGTNYNVEWLMAFWKEFDYRLYRVGAHGERLSLREGRWPEGLIGDCVAIADS